MSEVNQEVGKRIKRFRKSKGITIETLGKAIFKSKGTVSKYEKGDIAIDLVTLYAIAEELNIRIEQLLPVVKNERQSLANEMPSTFFKNATRYYAYSFDGRDNTLSRSVIDILDKTVENKYTTMLYMNVPDLEAYQICENTYIGHTEHYDTLTKMLLINQATPIESISLNILASFAEADQKWALMSGVSFRPFMPIACKMLLSKVPLEEDKALIEKLKISKEDYRLMKIFNMFSVT